MSAAPTDYPPAVLEEAKEAACAAASAAWARFDRDDRSGARAAESAGAQAYAAVLARHTVSARLARSPGGVLVLDAPGETIPAAVLSDTEPPPVDEDAAALGEAYERGLREGRDEERANAVALLRQAAAKLHRGALDVELSREARDRCAMKASEALTFAAYIERGDRAEQGAASS